MNALIAGTRGFVGLAIVESRTYWRQRASLLTNAIQPVLLLTLLWVSIGHVDIDAFMWLAVGMTMFNMIAASMFTLAMPLVEMRSAGSLQRLACFPVSVTAYLCAFCLVRVATVFVIAVLTLATACAIAGYAPPVLATMVGVVVVAISTCAFMAMGMVLASVVPSVPAMTSFNHVGLLLIMPVANAFIPPDVLPSSVAILSYYLPFAATPTVLREIIFQGAIPWDWRIFVGLPVLIGGCLVVFARNFRWR